MIRLFAIVCIAAVLAPQPASAAKKKKEKKEEVTQVLELPKDPPHAVTAQVERLVFHVSALSAKGLLSQQVRDALKSLFSQNRGAAIVKLRAFVAGTGDQRRVQAIVSEEFTDKRLPIPALSVVQVGALPLEGVQVVLESIAMAKKPVNAHGLAFISGQPGKAGNAAAPLQKLVASEDARKVTCFLDSFDQLNSVRSQIATAFPAAASNFVQLQRGSIGDFVECEAVAVLRAAPKEPMERLDVLEGRYSQSVRLAPGKILLSGTQQAFGQEEKDVRLGFDRLKKAVEAGGGDLQSAVMTHFYPLSKATAEHARKMRFDYWSKSAPPASTLLLFEGLPSLDASLAIDVITLAK